MGNLMPQLFVLHTLASGTTYIVTWIDLCFDNWLVFRLVVVWFVRATGPLILG